MMDLFWVLTESTHVLKLHTQKRGPFHYRVLECKSRKSRNTWSKRQIWPWSTKWSRAKANRVLPRERTGHSKHPLPATQEKTLHMDIIRWEIRLIIFFAAKDGEALYSQQKQDQGLTGSYHELLIAKFRLKLKKVEKTIQVWSKSNPLWLYSGSKK